MGTGLCFLVMIKCFVSLRQQRFFGFFLPSLSGGERWPLAVCPQSCLQKMQAVEESDPATAAESFMATRSFLL